MGSCRLITVFVRRSATYKYTADSPRKKETIMNEIELSIYEHEKNCDHNWEEQVDFRGCSFEDACLRCGKRRNRHPHH